MKTPRLSLSAALLPLFILVLLLTYNVTVFGDDALSGSNQFILLLGAAVAGLVGIKNKVTYGQILQKVGENLQSVTGPILILLLVGSLAGTWLLSGVIPAMIDYGLQIANPRFFLPACVLITALVSLATGSSWSTSATIGIALIGIGKALELPVGMVAGAVISGAYFGDKLSPLSDTTNLAPAMAGGELFTHIRYMLYTTLPSIIISLLIFIVLGWGFSSSGEVDTSSLSLSIREKFNINLWLFLVPLTVILMIVKKTPPLLALFIGTLLGGLFALIFQSQLLLELSGSEVLDFRAIYQTILNSITVNTQIETSDPLLNELFSSGGMQGMLGTVWLIICAMVYGGVMDAIGALQAISNAFLKWAHTTFQLVAGTAASSLTVNLTASDQYLAIVVPGKMFAQAYRDRKLAPENLSRTLEDAGTVTSVLVPWNTCGAYQSGVLGVGVAEYFIFAFFNWVSPLMTLIYAYFNIKIKKIKT
ncbi:MAG: Na+/H+ antiporter NhaC [Flavobacteriaceae bacterium]|nr:Na+/H+ antiporter NhaC [Flavobacteriaceae bacterium]MDG1029178.1 Na+/H+ antiporter NhaC [Flavobacteriaceae bacterium]